MFTITMRLGNIIILRRLLYLISTVPVALDTPNAVSLSSSFCESVLAFWIRQACAFFELCRGSVSIAYTRVFRSTWFYAYSIYRI